MSDPDDLGCPGSIPSSRDGISLTLREVEGTYALDVTNNRSGEVTGGVSYVLERLVGAAYVRINEDAVFTLQGIVVKPGQTMELTRVNPDQAESIDRDPDVDGELGPIGPGTYRVRTSVIPDGSDPNDQIEVAATFTLP